MRKEYDFSKAELVVPPIDHRKTRITIRIDTKILNWFRRRVHEAAGGNYQTMINEALKNYIESRDSRTIHYPGGPRSDMDDKLQTFQKAEGRELLAEGYNFIEKIWDQKFTDEKAA